MSSFSFGFSGDDIDHDMEAEEPQARSLAAETGSLRRPSNTAFPVAGQPMLPAKAHSLGELLDELPEKIAYSTLKVTLDDDSIIGIPRRELWDVRLQLMAQDDDVGLGKDDVKTGVYEGGFKSWESSVDLVKVLAQRLSKMDHVEDPKTVLEMGCGTALPSLALFQWQLQAKVGPGALTLGTADYNPTVLQLVTLPNLILSWAQCEQGSSFEEEGELEITAELLQAFHDKLSSSRISLHLFSGCWGPEFVSYVTSSMPFGETSSLVLAAETIYSPAATKFFTDALMEILKSQKSSALVAAKMVYFGVGGSIEDFCDAVRFLNGTVQKIREEADGVRRAIIEVRMVHAPRTDDP